jgi:hypothetical protein
MAALSIRVREMLGACRVCKDFHEKAFPQIKVARLRFSRWQLSFLIVILLSFAGSAHGQMGRDLELHGGYAHVTSDGGLDGFNAGAALHFTERVSIGFDYDSTWDRSRPTVFLTSSVGALIIRSYLANYLVGPRIFFPTKKLTFKNQKFIPFGEFQFGGSHLSTTVDQVGLPVTESVQ